MADRARGDTVVDAPVAVVWEVTCDLERYPSWAADVAEARVLTRDDAGLPATASFRVGAFGMTVGYTLAYTARPPGSLCWELVSSRELRRMDGEYRFTEEAPGRTRVDYELAVDLRVPVLGPVKRRAEKRIIDHALRGLKAEAERVHGGR